MRRRFGGQLAHAAPLAAAFTVLGVTPLIKTDLYFVHLLATALIYSVLAMGLQFVTGIAGQFSVGHVAFYGVGAYTSAITTVRYGLPVPLGALCGMVLAAAVGTAMAPITRLRGNYMAMATLAFLLVANLVFQNSTSVTGGAEGYGNIPSPHFFGYSIDDGIRYFYMSFVLVIVWFLVLHRLSGPSHFGRALAMIRQNETAAASIGVNLTAYKIKAFVISAGAAGFAGAMFAHQVRYVHPNNFTLQVAITVLMMIVVGGLGSLTGAIVGAFVLTFAPEYLRFLEDYRLVIYGIALIAIMIFMPEGLVGGVRATARVLRERLGLRRLVEEPAFQGPEVTQAELQVRQ